MMDDVFDTLLTSYVGLPSFLGVSFPETGGSDNAF